MQPKLIPSFSYVYDRYGNRWSQTATAGGGTWNQPSYNFDANNRIASGFTYDAAGNITNDSIHTYTYDAENRIVKVDTGTTAVYSYDAEGRRVSKTAGSASYEYLFDLGGRAVTELLAGTATTNRTEAYAGGRHLTTQNVGLGTSYFIHSDWLGTERVRTNLSGTATETCTSLAYGDDLSCAGTDVSPLHFTGKMRDAETSLDEFPARYYSSAQGRWYSPDWASAQVPVPYADLHNPQSLNLYDYVGSDPTNHADADGHLQTCPGCDRDENLQEQEQDKKAQADATKAQNQAQTQTQQKPGEEHKGDPYSLKPEGSTPVGNNGAKIVTYQVVDPTGRPVTNVSVQEHVKVVAAENVDVTSNPNFVHYPTGQVRDQVGPTAPSSNDHSFLKTEQTFTAQKGGNTYEMSTKVNQYVNVSHGNVTVQTVVIVP